MAATTTATKTPPKNAVHYEAHSAESYEQAYFYEAGAYQQYLVQLVHDRLQMKDASDGTDDTTGGLRGDEGRHILDIGGGTGNFAQALLFANDGDDRPAPTVDNDKDAAPAATTTTTTTTAAKRATRITVVDPFLDPTANVSDGHVSFVKASAEVFMHPPVSNVDPDSTMLWRCNFHQVLLKEVVHHLEDRVKIFRGMYQDLQPMVTAAAAGAGAGGADNDNDNDIVDDDTTKPPSLLLITRPQIDIDYPLWDAARTVWKQNQPSVDEFTNELQEAGFVDIKHTLESYPCQISLSRWQSMIRSRFWSTFSNFTDVELEAACVQLAVNYQDRVDEQGNLHFEDRLVFLTARKA